MERKYTPTTIEYPEYCNALKVIARFQLESALTFREDMIFDMSEEGETELPAACDAVEVLQQTLEMTNDTIMEELEGVIQSEQEKMIDEGKLFIFSDINEVR